MAGQCSFSLFKFSASKFEVKHRNPLSNTTLSPFLPLAGPPPLRVGSLQSRKLRTAVLPQRVAQDAPLRPLLGKGGGGLQPGLRGRAGWGCQRGICSATGRMGGQKGRECIHCISSPWHSSWECLKATPGARDRRNNTTLRFPRLPTQFFSLNTRSVTYQANVSLVRVPFQFQCLRDHHS